MAPHLSTDAAPVEYGLLPAKKAGIESTEQPNTTKSTALKAISHGITLPGRPIFSDAEKARQHMLEHMAGAFRVLARHGCVEGISGHISLRDPENSQVFWTNPYDSKQ